MLDDHQLAARCHRRQLQLAQESWTASEKRDDKAAGELRLACESLRRAVEATLPGGAGGMQGLAETAGDIRGLNLEEIEAARRELQALQQPLYNRTTALPPDNPNPGYRSPPVGYSVNRA